MSFVCDYCGKIGTAAVLRMVPDPSIGGALQMCCHDCYHDDNTCDDDGCAWFDRQTVEEWAEERQAQAEAAADDKAHARRSSLMEWVMFG